MKMMSQHDHFNSAMETILRADPRAVKAAVDAEIQSHTEGRKARGERKRGRKPKEKCSILTSDRALSAND